MPLAVEPRGVAVAHHLEIKAGPLRPRRVADQLRRVGLLGRQGVSDPCHATTNPARTARVHLNPDAGA